MFPIPMKRRVVQLSGQHSVYLQTHIREGTVRLDMHEALIFGHKNDFLCKEVQLASKYSPRFRTNVSASFETQRNCILRCHGCHASGFRAGTVRR